MHHGGCTRLERNSKFTGGNQVFLYACQYTGLATAESNIPLRRRVVNFSRAKFSPTDGEPGCASTSKDQASAAQRCGTIEVEFFKMDAEVAVLKPLCKVRTRDHRFQPRRLMRANLRAHRSNDRRTKQLHGDGQTGTDELDLLGQTVPT
jgi:hypothetical protein